MESSAPSSGPTATARRTRPRRAALVAFVATYFVVFVVVSFFRGNREFVFYAVVTGLLMALVWWMDRRVRFGPMVLWGLAVWGLLHFAGGNVPIGGVPEAATGSAGAARNVLYNWRPVAWLPRYDQWVHFYGFFIATITAFEALRAAVGGRLRVSAGVAFALAMVGMGLGALNEVVEFTATLLIPDTNVGGYVNTGWDLVSNLAGSLAASAVLWAGHRRTGREG